MNFGGVVPIKCGISTHQNRADNKANTVTLDDVTGKTNVLNFLLELDNPTVIYERHIKLSLYPQL